MDGITSTSSGFVSNGGGAFPFTMAADLNDDGNADLLSDGATNVRIQLVTFPAATIVVTTGFLSNGGGAYDLAAASDSSADGNDDLKFNGATQTRLNLMSGVTSTAQAFLSNGGGAFPLPALPNLPN